MKEDVAAQNFSSFLTPTVVACMKFHLCLGTASQDSNMFYSERILSNKPFPHSFS